MTNPQTPSQPTTNTSLKNRPPRFKSARALGAEDLKKLAWIHSNRAISTTTFFLKFFKNAPKIDRKNGELTGTGLTLRRARQVLNRFETAGVLEHYRQDRYSDFVYFVNKVGLNLLREHQVSLFGSIKPPEINPHLVFHNDRVAALRAHIETQMGDDLTFWLSDFEMRMGIKPELKKAFLEAKELKARKGIFEAWISRSRRPSILRRTPDGLFQIRDTDGEAETLVPYVLEYEHLPYSYVRILSVLNRLEDLFYSSLKIIVCSTPEKRDRMSRSIWDFGTLVRRRRPFVPSRWLVADFESVMASKDIADAFSIVEKPTETPIKEKKGRNKVLKP